MRRAWRRGKTNPRPRALRETAAEFAAPPSKKGRGENESNFLPATPLTPRPAAGLGVRLRVAGKTDP